MPIPAQHKTVQARVLAFVHRTRPKARLCASGTLSGFLTDSVSVHRKPLLLKEMFSVQKNAFLCKGGVTHLHSNCTQTLSFAEFIDS